MILLVNKLIPQDIFELPASLQSLPVELMKEVKISLQFFM
jgi:hypothetical protein